MTENEFAPLELYINFHTLPVRQVAIIMRGLSNIYALLRDPDFPIEYYDFDFYPRYGYWLDDEQWVNAVDSELCLDFARTGNSITFKFTGHGRFPVVTTNGADTEVDMPVSWGAAVVGVGVLLAGAAVSQEMYKQYLENQHQIAQTRTENLRGDLVAAEIANVRAKTDSIQHAMKTGTSNAKSIRERRKERAIINNVQVVQNILHTENIIGARVNSFPVVENDDGSDIDAETPES